jgi:hypothetical protein
MLSKLAAIPAANLCEVLPRVCHKEHVTFLRGTVMFLIRTAFWLAVVVMLLPTDEKTQAHLKAVAWNAAHQAATFCDRNAETCVKAGEVWSTFKMKLEFGARLAADLVSEHVFKSSDAKPALAPRPRALDPISRGTLTPTDMTPAWRPPAAPARGNS